MNITRGVIIIMITFDKSISNSKKSFIKRVSERALKDLGLNNVSFEFDIKKNLGADINVNYKNLRKKEVKIEIGTEALRDIGRNEIYHEMFHVRDAIWNNLDFSDGLKNENKRTKFLASIILNFSVDGRLEKMKLPHIPRNVRLNLTTNFLSKNGVNIDKTKIRKELEKLWGKNLKKRKNVLNLAKHLEEKFY